jgi:hypothetical protein
MHFSGVRLDDDWARRYERQEGELKHAPARLAALRAAYERHRRRSWQERIADEIAIVVLTLGAVAALVIGAIVVGWLVRHL